MNKIEIVPEERQKILENPDLILLDKELLLALLKDSDFPDEENLIDIRNVFLKKLGEKVEKLKSTNSQIIQHAYENQLGIKKIHKCCLKTIETRDIGALFKFLCLKATEILRVDVIKIVVSDNTFSDSNVQNCILKSNEELIKFSNKIEEVCIECVESGAMTKDLAILIGPSSRYLTTNQFLDEIDGRLKKKLN